MKLPYDALQSSFSIYNACLRLSSKGYCREPKGSPFIHVKFRVLSSFKKLCAKTQFFLLTKVSRLWPLHGTTEAHAAALVLLKDFVSVEIQYCRCLTNFVT